MSPKNRLFTVIVVVSIALDQLTKWFTVQYVGFRDEFDVIPGFLSIVHTKNRGAAFSALQDFEHRMVVFAIFTVIAAVVILYSLRELPDDDRYQTWALGLIFGGALGNGIDRILYQEVTDFIRVYTEWAPLSDWLRGQFGTSTWPIFNVADSAIVIGVILFLLHYLFMEDRGKGELSEEELAAAAAGVE